MALTTGTKRSRPAFEPPRPKKAKITKPSNEKDQSANGVRKRTSGAEKSGNRTGTKVVQGKPRQRVNRRENERGKQKQKQRGTGGTMRAILGDLSDEEMEAEVGQDDENVELLSLEVQSEPDSEASAESNDDDDEQNDDVEDELEDEEQPALLPSSPEPDFMLVEINDRSISQSKSKSKSNAMISLSDQRIPLPLIHRIMHAHFNTPDETAISTDARVLVGKYVEVFVKEAIRRCVDDKQERERTQNGGGGGGGGGGGRGRGGGRGDVDADTGWLEFEDLERVGVQLCLDF